MWLLRVYKHFVLCWLLIIVLPSLSEYDLLHREQFVLRQRLHGQMSGVRSLVQEVQENQR